MRYRTIAFWTLTLALLGLTSLSAQCPATAAPGQSISFQLSATTSAGPAPDGPNNAWLVSPDYFTATPPSGNHITTISGTIPGNATGSVTFQATYGNPSFPPPFYSFSCTIQIVTSQPLQINGSCPANSFSPGDPINVPFSASGGNTQQYAWSVTAPFIVTPQTGPNTSVQGNAPSASTQFQVTLSEAAVAGNSSKPAAPVSRTCQIVVNPNTPLQISGSCPTNSFLPNDPISIPFTASGGNTKQYFWNVSTPFSVSPATGASTTVTGNAPQSTTSFTLILSESPPFNTTSSTVAKPVSVTCQIVVVSPLGISGTCPTAAFAPGVPVSIPLAGSGGSGNYAWLINPTNVGLSLSSATGSTTTVQGTPAAGNQYTFTVTLSDNNFAKLTPATFPCTITVAGSVSISGTCPTQPIVTGASFTLPLSVTGGIAPYNWTVKADPLTPSSLTGASITLTGTPTTTADIVVSVSVQDSERQPQQASFRCTIRVVNPLTITGPACPIVQLQGKNVTVPLSGSGGSGNYSWTSTGAGFLSLTSGTGASTSLTGLASDAGTFPFTVNLADDIKTPLAAPFSCSVQVIATLTQQANFPDGFVGQAYPATTVNVSGGIPPYIVRVSKGPLPPGLVIDSTTGTVTGTPTQAGTFPFTVTVTDTGTNSDNRQLVTADYQIRIGSPLQNTTACPLPTGTELQPYSAPLTAAGGTGQYTFSLTGASLLPPGLVLDQNQNAITGTPEGPFPSTPLNFQLQSGTQTVNFTCAIAVLGRKPTVTVTGLFTNTGSALVTSSITLSVPVQEDVTGTAVLTFTPDVPNAAIKDNPQVQFCGGNASDPLCGAATKDSAGLLRVVPFTVRAGLPSVDLPPLVTSNVSGTIQIALNNLLVGPQTITAAPLRFTLSRAAPAILSTPQISRSGQSLQITLKVSSSTCELSSAAAAFTATPGSQLDGASSTTSLSSLFQNFAPSAVDATHPIGGCAFTLTLPYSISGDPGAISSVTLTLTNSVGPTSTAALPVQ